MTIHPTIPAERLPAALDEAIRRLIAAAIEADDVIYAGREAARLASSAEGCGWSAEAIADAIMEAAIHSGVALEMSRPDPSPT